MKYLISALIGALFVICMVEGQRRPPNYSLDEMPRTSFSCRDKIVGGYYADPETDCQMFHVCVRVAGLGVQDFRFLCPNDTSFDQENQICDDWYNIDCEASTLFYSDNFDLYRISDGVPEFGPSRATPISLGPSSAPPIYSKPKQRPSHLPVNNAVGEDDDDTYLQKADTGDRRLHKDLLRGSSSGNFFANRNNGKEDNDDDDNTSSADFSKNKFGDTQAKKKTAKVAVRKLLTGKRPVNQATEQSTVASTTPVASTTVASVQQNNNFGGRQRYNTVQRARVTTPAPYVETSTAYNTNNNNNFNNNNYNNNYNNNNYNSRNNYNNYQTPTTAAPTSSVAYNNNFRSRGNVNFNTYQNNNNQENNNNYQETSSTTQATTVNNNNFNRNYNQNYNNNNNYNNYQYQTSTANPFNYNYQSTNNNYQSTNNNNGAQQQGSTKFYTQQQNAQQSSTTSNYYQTQQQSTNNNNNNNYYQQQQYNNNNFNNNNYNAQSSSVASSAAYQQPTTYRTTSFNNNNYQQNYNGNNNYNQQSTTFNYDNYYQTSTVAPRAFDKSTTYYTTTVAPQPSGFQNYFDKSSTSQAVNTNNYQAKNGNYNFNVKASVGGNNNYDPYNIYNGRGNEKYDEPTLGESLKTAPSSNIRPSDLNALAYNKEVKKNVGFNATVGTSYNFDKNSSPTKKVNPYTVAVPTVKAATNPPVTAAVVTSTARPSLIPQAPSQQYQNVQRQQNTQTQQYQNVQRQQNTPQQNTQQTAQKLDNKSTAAPPAQSSPSSAAAKDNSYDYAYYDDASPSEYDGFEPAGEDFARTAARG